MEKDDEVEVFEVFEVVEVFKVVKVVEVEDVGVKDRSKDEIAVTFGFKEENWQSSLRYLVQSIEWWLSC